MVSAILTAAPPISDRSEIFLTTTFWFKDCLSSEATKFNVSSDSGLAVLIWTGISPSCFWAYVLNSSIRRGSFNNKWWRSKITKKLLIAAGRAEGGNATVASYKATAYFLMEIFLAIYCWHLTSDNLAWSSTPNTWSWTPERYTDLLRGSARWSLFRN